MGAATKWEEVILGSHEEKVVTLVATTTSPGRTGQDSKDSHYAAVRVLLSAEGDSGEKSKFKCLAPKQNSMHELTRQQ